jgi:hypothetical protein
MKSPRLLFSFP